MLTNDSPRKAKDPQMPEPPTSSQRSTATKENEAAKTVSRFRRRKAAAVKAPEGTTPDMFDFEELERKSPATDEEDHTKRSLGKEFNRMFQIYTPTSRSNKETGVQAKSECEEKEVQTVDEFEEDFEDVETSMKYCVASSAWPRHSPKTQQAPAPRKTRMDSINWRKA